MNNRNNNLNFKKNIKPSSNNKFLHLKHGQREALKLKLMDKYNISDVEAEKAIETIIKKEQGSNYKSFHNASSKSGSLGKSDKNIVKVNQQDFDGNKINKEENSKLVQGSAIPAQKNAQKIHSQIQDVNVRKSNDAQKIRNNKQNSNHSERLMQNQNSNERAHNLKGNKIQEPVIEKSSVTEKKQDVDDIMQDIIPNYNQDFSIEVNHVDLTFEVANEKVDTLKESFIRTLKRNKSKKLKVHALKDISFKIYKGEKVGIIGYNGAGKSTLLSVITGIYPPDKGFVKTNGNVSPMLSLGAGFDYNYSGRKNIFLNGAVLGYSREFLESKVDEIIEFSELGEFIDIPIKNYSSGMLAKLGFSIATAVDPDILIIDEVLGVGDVNFNKKSKDKMKSLMDGGTTVLLVSHSIPQIRELCDKAIWIDHGNLREMGEVNKVCDHYLKDAEKASNEQLANIQFR